MSAFVYLLRQPVSTLSSALFTSGEREWTVVPLEDAVTGPAPLAARHSHEPGVPQEDNGLKNYHDLLNVIMNARKVIIL